MLPSEASRLKSCRSPECKRRLPTLLAEQRAQYPADLPDLTPPSARRIHTREVRRCVICDGEFLIVPKADRVTCSDSCDSARRAESRRKHPAVITCQRCGRDAPRTVTYAGQKFCSDACRMAALNDLPRQPPQMAPCRTCGKLFRCPRGFRTPDADGKIRGVYCSRGCMWTDDDYRKRRAVRHSPSCLEVWLFAALDAEGVAYDKFATVGRYVPDALLTDHKVIIEVDGVIWHRKKVAYDQQRDRDLTAAGYTVMHFTDLEIRSAKQARKLIGEAMAEILAGRQQYRAPLLWRTKAP